MGPDIQEEDEEAYFYEDSTSIYMMSKNGGLYFPIHVYQLVDSPRTCHKLCSERDSTVNGWMFNSSHLTCQCIHMESDSFCVKKGQDVNKTQHFLFVNKTLSRPIYNCSGNISQ